MEIIKALDGNKQLLTNSGYAFFFTAEAAGKIWL
jgi:hypothetical protein